MTVSYFALAAVAAAQAVANTPAIQTSQPVMMVAPAPQQGVILGSTSDNVLRIGTEVPLRLEEGLDTNDKTLREGYRFRMTVANDVTLGKVIVIPAGTPATGEVVELRRKGMWGKSGRIIARVLTARVGDRMVRLTGNFDDKGVTGTAGVVGAIVFVPFAGFFISGTSAKMPAGSGVKAFLDEDLRVGTSR